MDLLDQPGALAAAHKRIAAQIRQGRTVGCGWRLETRNPPTATDLVEIADLVADSCVIGASPFWHLELDTEASCHGLAA